MGERRALAAVRPRRYCLAGQYIVCKEARLFELWRLWDAEIKRSTRRQVSLRTPAAEQVFARVPGTDTPGAFARAYREDGGAVSLDVPSIELHEVIAFDLI
jgi:hypothetical protein